MMTREEAIKVLNTYDVNFYEYRAEEIVDAIGMAIEALTYQNLSKPNNTCEDDLIRRRDAIEAVEELPNAYNGWSDAYDKACIIGALEEVPSAEPKTGECSGCKCLGSYESEFPCVNCVRITKDYYCGARMRGVDDEHTV